MYFLVLHLVGERTTVVKKSLGEGGAVDKRLQFRCRRSNRFPKLGQRRSCTQMGHNSSTIKTIKKQAELQDRVMTNKDVPLQIKAKTYLSTVFESLIQHCERSELCLLFEWTKVH